MKAKYKGSGRFIHGIPARDLTAAEFEGLSDAQQQAVIDSGLYKLVKAPAKKKTPAKKGSESQK